MFTDRTGSLRADAEATAARIEALSDSEVEALEERKEILRDALNSFNARLADLPARERNATLSLLFKEIADTIFDFHLSLETSATRANIAMAETNAEKLEALAEFQATTQDLALLYGIS